MPQPPLPPIRPVTNQNQQLRRNQTMSGLPDRPSDLQPPPRIVTSSSSGPLRRSQTAPTDDDGYAVVNFSVYDGSESRRPPQYLSELFVPPTSRPSRYALRSASSNQLDVISVKPSSLCFQVFQFGIASRNISQKEGRGGKRVEGATPSKNVANPSLAGGLRSAPNRLTDAAQTP